MVVKGTVVAATFVTTTVVRVISPDDKKMCIDEAAFVDVEFALLVSAVSRENTQRLVSANGGVTTPGLFFYCYTAVHAAARKQVPQGISDIRSPGAVSTLGSHKLPASLFWRT